MAIAGTDGKISVQQLNNPQGAPEPARSQNKAMASEDLAHLLELPQQKQQVLSIFQNTFSPSLSPSIVLAGYSMHLST